MDFSMAEKRTLPNGVRILMLPDDRFSSAAVTIWIGGGSRLETPETLGYSHFVEHMLFKGTPTCSAGDIASIMDNIGGHLNAYTAKEHTTLYSRALRCHLPIAVNLMCDMLTSPKLDEKDIALEKGVILAEMAMCEDTPEDLLSDTSHLTVWGSHALGANILGTEETVTAVTADRLRAFLRENYVGSRVVCAVCGNFDTEEVFALLEQRLSVLPADGSPLDPTPAQYQRNFIVVEKDFEQTHIELLFPAIPAYTDRHYHLGFLNAVCGCSLSSRLFQRLREQLGLVYNVGSDCMLYMREGVFSVAAAVNPENADAALREITLVLAELHKNGITQQEFERVREQFRAGILMGLEGNSSCAAHMAGGELLLGKVRTVDELTRRMDEVTLEQVNAAARDFIDFDSFSLCAVGKVRESDHYISIVQNTII
ncbi:MAG: insulinase family protein [Ruminococcaceae bacterium]|nr:insulinase family protein [Oscillospiraceae bacterium]